MFEKVKTFTGETILYDDLNHKYKTLDGKEMMSGSQFSSQFIDKFDVEKEAQKFAMKHGVSVDTIKKIWQNNSEISTGFGTAVHLALETYMSFCYEVDHIKTKGYNYALPSNPTMRKMVEKYIKTLGMPPPGYQEPFISDVENLMVGQIDKIDIISEEHKICDVRDYKNIYDIHKKKKYNFPYNFVDTQLKACFMQIDFYSAMLKKFGWEVRNEIIDNWDGEEWKQYIQKPSKLLSNNSIIN